MANGQNHKVPKIPDGFQDLLEDLSYDVLKAQPQDLLRFCVDNLTARLNMRPGQGSQKKEPDRTSVTKINPPQKEPERSSVTNIKPQQEESFGADFDVSADMSQSEARPPKSAAMGRRGGVAAESWDPENVAETERVVYPKSEEQKAYLLQAVRKILLFRCLDEDDRADVVDAMFERKVQQGEDVITYGEMGDNFYIIERGTYDVHVMVDGNLTKVTQYVDSGSFGELALMYNTPRAATIRAVTEGKLWAMSRETFRSIVLTKAFKKRKLYESLLDSVDLLQALSTYDRTSLADALYTRIVERDEAVFLQGEVGEEMYFIESGSVAVRMKQDDSAEPVELCTLGQYQYFGELALLTKQPRAASVYALERTRLAVLEVDSFERILGPCQTLLEQKAKEYAERREQLSIERAL